MRRLLPAPACISHFCFDRQAVAALEFALMLPFLLVLVSGAYEFSRAVNASRRLTDLANSVSGILATNATGNVTYVDLHYAFDSTMLTFSDVLSDAHSKGIAWGSDITISMAGVSFTPLIPGCTSSCTYIANIVWTGAAGMRLCATHPIAAPDSSVPTPLTLPADLFTGISNPQGGTAPPRFAIVVDVSYNWTPLIFTKLIGPIVMARSAFLTPRYESQITYSTVSGDDGFGTECPGF